MIVEYKRYLDDFWIVHLCLMMSNNVNSKLVAVYCREGESFLMHFIEGGTEQKRLGNGAICHFESVSLSELRAIWL